MTELGKVLGGAISERDSIRSEQVKQDTISNYFVLTDYRIKLKSTYFRIRKREITGGFILGHPDFAVLGTSELGASYGSYSTEYEDSITRNLTTVARLAVASWLSDESPTAPVYLGTGTGTTAYTVADTELGTETSFPRLELSVDISTSKTVDYSYSSHILTLSGVREFGLFDSQATGGLNDVDVQFRFNGGGTDYGESGKIGQAANFNGSTSTIQVSADASITNIFDGGGTIACWIFVANDGGSDAGRIVDKTDWVFAVTADDGENCKIYLYYVTTGVGTDGYWLSDSLIVPMGQWVHVALVFDADDMANNAPTIYVNSTAYTEGDGLTEQLGVGGTRNDDSTDDLYIGNNSANNRDFSGAIDDFRIYGSALTADNIATLYNSGAGTEDTDAVAGIISHYTFNGDSDDQAGSNDGSDTAIVYEATVVDTNISYITTPLTQGASYNGTDSIQTITWPPLAMTNLFVTGGTLSFWVYANGNGAQTEKVIDTSSGFDLNFGQATATHTSLNFFVNFSGTDGRWVSGDVIPLGVWTHIIITYDGSATTNDPVFYINNSSTTVTESSTPVGHIEIINVAMYFGDDGISTDRPFEGVLDDLRFYNRVITSDERALIYNSGKGSEVDTYTYGVGNLYYRLVSSSGITTSNTHEWDFLLRLELADQSVGDAVVVDEGLNQIRNWFGGSSATVPGYIEWNDATGEPAVDDTASDWDSGGSNEQRNAFTTSTRSGVVVQQESLLTTANMNGTTMRKSGTFNAASNGNLFGQTRYGAIEKTALFQVYEIDRYTIQ